MQIIRHSLIALVSIATLSWAVAGPDDTKDDSNGAGGGINSTNDPVKAEPTALKLAELGQCPTQPKMVCWTAECQGYGRSIHGPIYECTNVEPVQLGQEGTNNEDNKSTILDSSQHSQSQDNQSQPQPQQRAAAALVILAGCPCCTPIKYTWCSALECQALPGTAVCREESELAGCPCTTQEEIEERERRAQSPTLPSDWEPPPMCGEISCRRGTKSPSPRATMYHVPLPALPSLWLASSSISISMSSNSSATTTIVNAFLAMDALVPPHTM
ncbi:hypothetical protein PG984_013953 [Apiospora sp. TS-2023a]